MAAWAGCSAGCGRRARWARSCAGSVSGGVRQLDDVVARLLANLAAHTPLLPGAGQLAWIDVDDTIGGTHGHTKQGAGRGYSGLEGLNALIAADAMALANILRTDAHLHRMLPNNRCRCAITHVGADLSRRHVAPH